MSQARKVSLVESWANVAIGLVINYCMNMLVLPRFGFQITAHQNLILIAIYTGISVARSYAIRRWFNRVG